MKDASNIQITKKLLEELQRERRIIAEASQRLQKLKHALQKSAVIRTERALRETLKSAGGEVTFEDKLALAKPLVDKILESKKTELLEATGTYGSCRFHGQSDGNGNMVLVLNEVSIKIKITGRFVTTDLRRQKGNYYAEG